MSTHTADDFRAAGLFSVDAGLGITTAPTTTLPYRLAPAEAMKISKGASWVYTLTWYRQGDDPINLQADDYSASFTVRTSPASAVLIALTDGDGITLGTGIGNIVLALSAAATDALSFVRGWARLVALDPDGRTWPLLEGFCDLVG